MKAPLEGAFWMCADFREGDAFDLNGTLARHFLLGWPSSFNKKLGDLLRFLSVVLLYKI